MYLGNVAINEFLRRTGYKMSNEDINILQTHLQDNATILANSDKFHIFDIPFAIIVGKDFKTQLTNILIKYENKKPSKEKLHILEAVESEKEKSARLVKEQEQLLKEQRDNNPNSIWNIKWHMLVPVMVNNRQFYYGCFINTYTKGKTNIPNMIYGHGNISKDEHGLHGTFILDEPEIVNDADLDPTFNYVIGMGLYTEDGKYIGSNTNYLFERVDFSINECIENYKKMDRIHREIHFSRYDK